MAVNVHDFPDPEVGKAIPYGLYDLAQNSGWVSVGTDHDTASFAVATIRRWWYGEGSSIYSDADRLFDLRRRWGQQWYRLRLWKKELAELGISFTQVPRDLVAGLPFVKPTGPTSWGHLSESNTPLLAELAKEIGLQITVCHFSPGTSKWNRVEYRLFSAISMNWRGHPLTSHQVVVDLIGATTTGLRVHAELDDNNYPTSVKVSDEELAKVAAQTPEVSRRVELVDRPGRLLKSDSYSATSPYPRSLGTLTRNSLWPARPEYVVGKYSAVRREGTIFGC